MLGVDEIIRTARLVGVERQWDRERIGLTFGIGAGEMTLRELAGGGGEEHAPRPSDLWPLACRADLRAAAGSTFRQAQAVSFG